MIAAEANYEKDIFLEDEVKDGFYVPSMMKRAWRQSLLLLRELDRVCTKHGLHYYLEWGTLLGAVRHGGFIPWDDDVDVCMHRNDVEKLKALAPQEFPEGYTFLNFENSDNWEFTESFANTERMNFSEDYLLEHDGFPYISSIDIFVLDNVTDDREYEEKRAKDINQLLLLFEYLDRQKMGAKDLKVMRQLIHEKTGLCMQGLSKIDMKRQLLREARRIMMLNDNEETDYVVQMVPWGLRFNRYTHRSVYEKPVRIPFEGMEVCVPACYDELLTIKFSRGYPIIRYGTGSHDYPFFEGQAGQLGQKVDYPIRYKFQKSSLNRKPADKSNSLKETAKDFIDYMADANKRLDVLSVEERQTLLEECQAVAIDFGTLVELIKGEGTKMVSCLEKYCEVLYQISVGSVELSALKAAADSAEAAVKEGIINRREVLLIPYKPEHWNGLHRIWEEKMREPDADVYVLAVPYFYKDYDGRLRDMVYEPEKYPKELNVVEYGDYALLLHCPDEIYIQNPYDEYNMAISIHPDYYASKLRQYTDHLVYIPYFKTSDFERSNKPAVYNMRDYCTVPGVVLADRVILQSKIIRERYIEVLSEFAGRSTKKIWEEKIAVDEPQKIDSRKEKKTVVFGCCLGTLLKYQQEYFSHLGTVLDTFRTAADDINVIWHVEPWMERQLKEYDAELYVSWQRMRQDYEAAGWGTVDDTTKPCDLAEKADAYYGDTTVCLKEFELRGKPIMLANPAVNLSASI